MEELETPPEGVIPEPEPSGLTQEPQAAETAETSSPEVAEPQPEAADPEAIPDSQEAGQAVEAAVDPHTAGETRGVPSVASEEPQAAGPSATSSPEVAKPRPAAAAPEAIPDSHNAIVDTPEAGEARGEPSAPEEQQAAGSSATRSPGQTEPRPEAAAPEAVPHSQEAGNAVVDTPKAGEARGEPSAPEEQQAAGSSATSSPGETEPRPEAAAPHSQEAGNAVVDTPEAGGTGDEPSASEEPQAAGSSATRSPGQTEPRPEAAAPEAVPHLQEAGNAVVDMPRAGETGGEPFASAEPQAAGLSGTSSPEVAVPQPAAARVEAAGDSPAESVSMEEFLGTSEPAPEAPPASVEDSQLRAVLEAIVYVAEEPLTLAQLAIALQQPASRIKDLLEALVAEFDKPEHGVTIREVAGGFKMATKPEHHDAVRSFVKSLKPPLKLSLPALETLAVIAYKQPVTSPEIMEIRGVRGAGVLNTLLDRKLIAAAGRKNVIGKPILYKTTKEFLIQFGLKDLSELPSLKEFEEIRRMAFADSEVEAAPAEALEAPAATPSEPAVEPMAETPPAPESQES